MANWTGNPSMPLLGAGVRPDGREESAIDIMDHPSAGLTPPIAPSAAPLHFRCRLRRLLAELRPFEALALAALSIVESIIVAQVGKVAGSFYEIMVDKHPAALLSSLLHAASLYAGCVATAAAGVWLSGRLAVRWRHHLSSLLHRGYCSKMAFLSLPGHLDNPDQRMTAEVAALCDALAAAVRLAAGAPFRVVYYSVVAWKYLGWRGIAAAVAFFWIAALLQRLAAAPLARCMVAQERREGNLRFSHLRMRDRVAEIAAYRGAGAEKISLDDGLAAAVANQRRLVAWRTAVTVTTRTTDYSGALLNYGLVGAAVFSGAAGAATGGELAQFVSNASFASLSLIYSFTEILDLAEQLSVLAALTARVVGLLEALPLPGRRSSAGDGLQDLDGGDVGAIDALSLRRGNSGEVALARRRAAATTASAASPPSERELQPSGLAVTLQPPVEASYLDGTVPMEVSIHSLGSDLQAEARRIFPDAPPPGAAHLLCLLTFQFAGGGAVDLSPDRSAVALAAAAAEQDRLLDCFLRWEAGLRAALGRLGGVKGRTYWCDAVDPRTGAALHGSRGERWSEVAAARALLRYAKRDAGVCPLVVHPRHGTSAYPASFFTDAPADFVAAALAELAGSDAARLPIPPSPFPSSRPGAPGPALVTIEGLGYSTPGGRKSLVHGLRLTVTPGEGLLVSGPNGAGKSTLLRVLAGLHAPTTGVFRFGAGLPQEDPFEDPGAAMLLPQRPLPAPGQALWQQLAYPGTARPPDGLMRSLLQEVGLAHILERSAAGNDSTIESSGGGGGGGDVGNSGGSGLDVEEADWGAALSPGEMQRLAIARVLLRRPALALLDEPFSAMGDAAAAGLLRLLRSAGVTCVTVAQDTPAYLHAHAAHLRLGGSDAEGRWELGPSGIRSADVE